jgi:hypothetical protein
MTSARGYAHGRGDHVADPVYGVPLSGNDAGPPRADGPHVCGTLVHVNHILFRPGVQQCESAIFEVTDKPAIITGFEFSDGACACLEVVEGCGGGDYFAPLRLGCGPATCISQCSNRVVLDIPGRYRLVWKNCDVDEAMVVLRYAAIPYAPAYVTKPTGCCEGCSTGQCGCDGPCTTSGTLRDFGSVL